MKAAVFVLALLAVLAGLASVSSASRTALAERTRRRRESQGEGGMAMQATTLEGGLADAEELAAGLSDEELAGVSLQEEVQQKARQKAEAQDRVWQTDVGAGGSTIVLSNRNSLQIKQRRPDQRNLKEYKKYVEAEEGRKQKHRKEIEELNEKHQREKDAFEAERAEKNKEKRAELERENLIKQATVLEGVWEPEGKRKVREGKDMDYTDAYTFMFWVKPTGTVSTWSQIFQRGSTSHDRNMLAAMYPGSTRLHLRSSTSASWNDGLDMEGELLQDEWTHVVFTHQANDARVYLNGKLHKKRSIPAPLRSTGPLWACFHDRPSKVKGANLVWLNRVASEEEIETAAKARPE